MKKYIFSFLKGLIILLSVFFLDFILSGNWIIDKGGISFLITFVICVVIVDILRKK